MTRKSFVLELGSGADLRGGDFDQSRRQSREGCHL